MSDARIVYLLSHMPGPRINKRIEVAAHSFGVSIIYWEKRNNPPQYQTELDVDVNCHNEVANQTDPLKRIMPWLSFSSYALKRLRIINPNVIHCQGLDMLLVAVKYKKKHAPDVDIVYEISDLHRLMVDEQRDVVKKVAQRVIRRGEVYASKYVSKIIVTSERFYDNYYRKLYEEKDVLFMPNAPLKKLFKDYVPKNHALNFTVGFIGVIRHSDEAIRLIEATESIGVNAFFAGTEFGDDVKKASNLKNHVTYFGPYDYSSQIAEIYGKCDVVYSVYPITASNVLSALPNKLYEAIVCALPILVSEGTYVGELVTRWGVGLTVDSNDRASLENAISKLAYDSSLYHTIQLACAERRDSSFADSFNVNYENMLVDLCNKS